MADMETIFELRRIRFRLGMIVFFLYAPLLGTGLFVLFLLGIIGVGA